MITSYVGFTKEEYSKLKSFLNQNSINHEEKYDGYRVYVKARMTQPQYKIIMKFIKGEC